MRIGMLTGGGDCPGLNAVIRAVVRKGEAAHGHEFIGFLHGWRGVMEGETTPLSIASTRGILARGGTILLSSRTNPYRAEDGAARVRATLDRMGVDALIAIGGEDTLGVARRLGARGGLRKRLAESEEAFDLHEIDARAHLDEGVLGSETGPHADEVEMPLRVEQEVDGGHPAQAHLAREVERGSPHGRSNCGAAVEAVDRGRRRLGDHAAVILADARLHVPDHHVIDPVAHDVHLDVARTLDVTLEHDRLAVGVAGVREDPGLDTVEIVQDLERARLREPERRLHHQG